MPVVQENQVDLNDSTLIPESGCGSPVKPNTQSIKEKDKKTPDPV